MLTSVYRSHVGITALVSPNDDDRLVYLKAVDQIRHERSLRPSHVKDGGGDVSYVNSENHTEFERPYFGPSHVEDGGGAELKNDNRVSNRWRRQSEIPKIELPTEIRKAELKRRMKVSEQQPISDPIFFGPAWRIKRSFGTQREKALTNFWREAYKEVNHDDQRVFREFALNDYLEASDELHDLEHPMRPNSWSWGSFWKERHRSSAATVGLSSLGSPIVGTGSVHSSRNHPVNTVGFSN
jgi:hypothetical protein